MNRSSFVPVLLASIAFVVGAFLVARSIRYEVVPAEEGDDVAWVVDRASGEIARIVDTGRHPVRPAGEKTPAPARPGRAEEDEARRQAGGFEFDVGRNHWYLGAYVREWLRRAKGPLDIEGWKVKRVGEGKYLVTFTFTNGGRRYGWAIETIHVPNQGWITRDALADPGLRRAYGLEELEPPPPLP